MTTRLLLAIILLQDEWRPGDAWCFYSCPKERWPETFCAVDKVRGAKLFQGRCMIWRENYCQTAEYRVTDMQQCLDRPAALLQFLASKTTLRRFDLSRAPPAVGPWRRFFILWSLLSRLSPPVGLSVPLIKWLLNSQSPIFNPFYNPKSSQFDSYTYPGSPFDNPIFNPLFNPGSPLNNPYP